MDVPVDPSEFADAAEARMEQKDPTVTQNSRNEIYFNPRAMHAFDSTVVMPDRAVGFKILSDHEVVLRFAPKGTARTVPLRRPANWRTGYCSFGPVLETFPYLKVRKGWQHRYPYRIDTLEDGSKRFVLLIHKPKVVGVVSRNRTATKKSR